MGALIICAILRMVCKRFPTSKLRISKNSRRRNTIHIKRILQKQNAVYVLQKKNTRFRLKRDGCANTQHTRIMQRISGFKPFSLKKDLVSCMALALNLMVGV